MASEGGSVRWMMVFLVLGTVAASVTGLAGSADECDPYPIGYCGQYQRQTVVFCYYVVDGRYVSATETDVTALAAPSVDAIVFNPEKTYGYVWNPAVRAVMADPVGGPHDQVLYVEDNGVPGLQVRPFRCGSFVWFTEIHDGVWMGPFNVAPKAPDHPLTEVAANAPSTDPWPVGALTAILGDPLGFMCFGYDQVSWVWALQQLPLAAACEHGLPVPGGA